MRWNNALEETQLPNDDTSCLLGDLRNARRLHFHYTNGQLLVSDYGMLYLRHVSRPNHSSIDGNGCRVDLPSGSSDDEWDLDDDGLAVWWILRNFQRVSGKH